MKYLLIITGVIIHATYLFGQGYLTISGKITDEKQQPLPGAAIVLTPGNRAATTN